MKLTPLLPQEQRRDVLLKYASLIRENQERLRWLDTVVTGKDSTVGGFEVGFAADNFECEAESPMLLFRSKTADDEFELQTLPI